ncbi:ferrous iron transport protein A [Candidatus Bipolaricaulota bacterium]|nr:ferrous iron transport protein A [Candidatus Bipolaricaulota bacterium]
MISLDRLSAGRTARIVQIRGGRGFRRNLEHMGVHPGDPVRVVGSGAFHGPLLLEVCGGGRIAVGRGIARHVMVELPGGDTADGCAE